MVEVLIVILLLVLVVFAIQRFGTPEPIRTILFVVLAVILILVLLNALGYPLWRGRV